MDFRIDTTADILALGRMNKQLIRDEAHRNPMNLWQLTARLAEFLFRKWLVKRHGLRNE